MTGLQLLLIEINYYIVSGLSLVIFIDVILTWIPSIDSRNPVVRMIRSFTGPLYSWVRKNIPVRFGMFDFAPLLIILALQIIGRIVQQIILAL